MEEIQPQIYSVKAVTVSAIPPVVFSRVAPTEHFAPSKARRAVMNLFDQLIRDLTQLRSSVRNSKVLDFWSADSRQTPNMVPQNSWSVSLLPWKVFLLQDAR